MFCHECGKKLDEKSIYCPYCGAKCLAKNADDVKTATENITENHTPSYNGEKQGAPKSKMPLYLGIGGGILAIVFIIALAAIFGGKEQDEGNNAFTGAIDYFDYFQESAGTFIRETGLELTFEDDSNLYRGYDGNVELSASGENEGINYFKLAVAIDDSSVLGVSIGMDQDAAAATLQKNGLYEASAENNHIVYKEQNGNYSLDVGCSVEDNTVNSITYSLETEEDSTENENAETQDTETANVDSGDTYNYYYYNVPYTPERSYKYSNQDGYLWPTDRYYISTSDLANYTKDEVAAIRNEIYARHGYVFKTDKWSSYFNARSWYTPNYNYSESLLTAVERTNIDTIVKYEKAMGWK